MMPASKRGEVTDKEVRRELEKFLESRPKKRKTKKKPSSTGAPTPERPLNE